MRGGAWKLARRYLAYHRARTAILVVSLALVSFLPIALEFLVGHFTRSLMARADTTPLIVGAPGSRYDLVLNTLYFQGKVQDPLAMRHVDKIRAGGLATPVPILVRYRAGGGYPLIGTTLDYFDFRGLWVADGTLPLRLGDVVLGARVADELDLSAGDSILSDHEKIYDISSTYPLRMRVTGVLAPTGGIDDGAVFADVKTTWVVEGIVHGHQELGQDSSVLLTTEDDVPTANASLRHYYEITDSNIDSFHFHGDPGSFPITAILALPADRKSETILKGRLKVDKEMQGLDPPQVLGELFDVVFRIKAFFDANFALVLLATVLFLVLIVWLTLQVRAAEIAMLHKLGCSRGMIVRIQAAELMIVVGGGVLLATATAGVVFVVIVRFFS